jgi:hypothetical protein
MGGGGARTAPTIQETWEERYDSLMAQFAGDMSLYMRWVGGRARECGTECDGLPTKACGAMIAFRPGVVHMA